MYFLLLITGYYYHPIYTVVIITILFVNNWSFPLYIYCYWLGISIQLLVLKNCYFLL